MCRKLFRNTLKHLLAFGLVLISIASFSGIVHAATSSDSLGIEGKVPGNPPSSAPTITVPADGSSLTTLPVTVSGLCQNGLLIKIFKNNVFGGSTICKNGSYSIQIDLFVGKNELIARAYDSLEQSSPDSNKITVNFPVSQFSGTNRVSLSSSYARRGASPGSVLTWPIILSGGNGPYAITVDWGDGTPPDVISRQFPGTFDISHSYKSAGVYNVLIRASDKNGEEAFLQLVGVGNGEIADTNKGSNQQPGATTTQQPTKVLWWPAVILIPLIAVAFWLGRKHELISLRRKLERR